MIQIGKLDATPVATPVGCIWVAASDEGVVAVSLWDDEAKFLAEVAKLTGEMPDPQASPGPILVMALDELDAYLRGQLRQFTSQIDWSTMKPFQREALELVCNIPYGRTTTYGAIAQQLGKPGAVRAVGRANATNPLPIIIPCHRVLGADGKLHGYGARGGLETKAWLLRLEGSWLI
jgi:methylated-DNA-[protein]-cysteine S-methyltransferase